MNLRSRCDASNKLVVADRAHVLERILRLDGKGGSVTRGRDGERNAVGVGCRCTRQARLDEERGRLVRGAQVHLHVVDALLLRSVGYGVCAVCHVSDSALEHTATNRGDVSKVLVSTAGLDVAPCVV
eukprot:1131096-Rhodomonas_salina.6